MKQRQKNRIKVNRKIFRIITLFLFVIISLSFNQTPKNNGSKIYWSSDTKLTWDDFQGKPSQGSKHGAISSISMGPQYEFKDNVIEVDTRSFFDKSKSWSKAEKQTDKALKHEQGHFDIGEVYARKLRKEISKCQFKKKDLQKKFEAKINAIYNEYLKYQELYDKETEHHRNEQKQSEWNLKIQKELLDLEEFKESFLSIKVK